MPQGKRPPEPEPESRPPVGAIVAATLLAFAGLAFGLVIGGDGDPRPVTVVRTVTVSTTETVKRTRTVVKTVTEAADDFAADTDTVTTRAADDDEECSLDYLGACVPTDDPELGCADLRDEDFDSIGDDPYDLDPDGDGIACET